MFNKYALNPAYAGFDFSLNATGIYRSQWTGLAGNPESQFFNAHAPVYILGGAMGFQLENERLGAERNTTVKLSYNYVLETSVGYFSIGAAGGIIQKRLNGSALIAPDGEYQDGSVNHNDPLIPNSTEATIGVRASLGVFYMNDFLETGFSISDFTGSRLQFASTMVELVPHFNYFILSDFYFGNGLVISPSLVIRSDINQTQVEISTLLKHNGNVFGGIGLRGYNSKTLDSGVVIIGWKFNENYLLAYSYDIGLNSLASVNEGSHEILLNYNLNKLIGVGIPPKIKYNPRHL